MKWIVFFSVLLLPASATLASAQVEGSDSSRVHVVRPGDTLWDLARQYLSNPFLWPEIFSVNRAAVGDPDLIFPQSRLMIPSLAGRAGAQPPAGARQAGLVPAPGRGPVAPPNRTVFYSGEGGPAAPTSTLRLTPQEEIPVVPSGLFFSAGVLVPAEEVQAVARLVEVISPTVISRSAPPQIHPFDKVNLVITGDGVVIGQRLQLIRPAREVRPYGRIYVPTGSGRVLNVEAGVATVEVDRFYERVEIGDLAVPMPEFEPAVGVAPVPASGLEGQLLAFRSTEPLIGTQDVAFVNLGAASGVVVGDEFEAYLPAVQEAWGRRPEVAVARLQVVRVSRLTSAVRVVSLEHPALEEGLPVRLVARMP